MNRTIALCMTFVLAAASFANAQTEPPFDPSTGDPGPPNLPPLEEMFQDESQPATEMELSDGDDTLPGVIQLKFEDLDIAAGESGTIDSLQSTVYTFDWVQQKQALHSAIDEAAILYLGELSTDLDSDDAEQQAGALRRLISWQATFAETDQPLSPVALAAVPSLTHCVDSSDETVADLARFAVENYFPVLAVELGLQRHQHRWLPLEITGESPSSELRRKLESLSLQAMSISYMPLEYAFSEIANSNLIKFRVDDAIDQSIEMPDVLDGVALGYVLNHLLPERGIAYRFDGNVLHFLPADSKAATVSLTYNVRGLLTEEVDVERVLELIAADSGLDVKCEVMGTDRIRVQGTEPAQHALSAFLLNLAATGE